MRHIISASRRTDVPAFYTDWFIKRLHEGFLYTKNPYSGKVYFVSLKPEDIHSIVFWSKDFSPLIRRIEETERLTRNLFFHFTITGVPGELEGKTPEAQEAIKDLIFLSKRYSPSHIVWRFDPIVLTDKTPFGHYEGAFARHSELLKGHVRECSISFVEPYRKVLNNLERYTDESLTQVSPEEKRRYGQRLAQIAERSGIKLSACCNDILLSDNIVKASCINGERLARLFNDYDLSTEKTPTRKGCGCTKSIDIGSYDTCPHGCVYCYANSDKEKAGEFFKNHNAEWNGLGFDEVNK